MKGLEVSNDFAADPTGQDAAEPRGLECEVRGNLWEGIHAVIFYTAVTCAILASVGVHRLTLGIACVVLLAYSMFAIFSSPTFVRFDAGAREATVDTYRYFLLRSRRFSRENLEGITVVEARREPAPPGEKGTRRDLSYFVRVYLRLANGRRLKIFRSGISGSPYENREKAYLIAEEASRALGLPVEYSRRGTGKGEEGPGAER